ncbi:MAG: BrnT family toxin [bacterium]|nr:BrnT family toxin [bacterium]
MEAGRQAGTTRTSPEGRGPTSRLRLYNGLCSIFTESVLEHRDDRFDYGEVRMAAIGVVDGIEMTVYTTDRDQRRRLISARKATRDERPLAAAGAPVRWTEFGQRPENRSPSAFASNCGRRKTRNALRRGKRGARSPRRSGDDAGHGRLRTAPLVCSAAPVVSRSAGSRQHLLQHSFCAAAYRTTSLSGPRSGVGRDRAAARGFAHPL